MKTYLLILYLLATCLQYLQAQNYTVSTYIGDDGDYWSGAYIYKFFSLGTNLSDEQDLPFNFDFYGQSVSSYRIAHSGYITFNTASAASINSNTALPNTSGPNNAIYALWDDFTTASTISTKTYGTAPNRVHQITWAGLNYPGAAPWQDDITVSLNLYENCGDFEIVVIDNNILPSSSFYPMLNTTIGCENATGTLGTQIAGSPNYIPSDPSWDKALYEVHRFRWNAPIVHDASLIGIDIDNHLSIGNHTLKGSVRNEGDASLTSYDINYSLNNGPTQTASISGVNASNSQKSFWTHTVPIHISSPNDQYELRVWVSNVNGMPDEMSCNNVLTEYITGINNNSSPKKILLEEFTGTWCGYCIDGAVIMENLVAQHGSNLIPVAIHDGDSMEFNDGLRTAFSVAAYPSGMIDRKNSTSGTTYTQEPSGRGSWSSLVSNQLNSFTPVDVDIQHSWNPNTRVINATVSANYSDNSAGDARIVLMVVEDSLTGQGSGWNQANYYNTTTGHPYYGAGSSVVGFTHRHVLRDYVEGGCFGVDGVIPHHVSAGSNYQHQFQYTLPPNINPNKVTLVAAIAKYMDTNDAMYIGVRGQRYIYNAEQTHLMTMTNTVAIEDNAANVLVYPNPTNAQVKIDVNNYNGSIITKVFNLAGQLLETNSSTTIDLSNYAAGLYLFQVHYEDKVKHIRVEKVD
ncbi:MULTISPECIES: Omp28-related outer membrane protein [unclassified Aureispira]|uniref:Omp28-related outer membrane protein n=1 Tax=unclassified Aureispira TaxID=2649989 RepID=UPI000698CAB9|nr:MULTISPECIES: Omp28-related outer membrane protein [unclassified Aureispira]WMX15161.1 Omp28-related outer membrane protein [Aureispira sp. CCB-E]